tara:strand:+ start:214 stop:618 length:405 start_codon:yes stop_codon:yes gene_type:complete
MATKKNRFYFIDTHSDGEKIAIVEKATNAVTKDGWTSDYKTISETGTNIIKIRGSFLDDDLSNDTLTGSYSNIPSRFHEAIVNKVIAMGYKDPRHMELNTAQYFDNEYEKGVKKGKVFARSNYQTVGVVNSQDY